MNFVLQIFEVPRHHFSRSYFSRSLSSGPLFQIEPGIYAVVLDVTFKRSLKEHTCNWEQRVADVPLKLQDISIRLFRYVTWMNILLQSMPREAYNTPERSLLTWIILLHSLKLFICFFQKLISENIKVKYYLMVFYLCVEVASRKNFSRGFTVHENFIKLNVPSVKILLKKK